MVSWTIRALLVAPLFFGARIGCAEDTVGQEIKRLCRETADYAPDDSLRLEERRRTKLAAMGEQGRKVLRRLARTDTPDGFCALGFLIDYFEDRRALPIIRRILRDRQASPGMKAQALNGVRVFHDTASFDQVLLAFRSGHRELVGPAASALGALRNERGLKVLRESLADPKYLDALRYVVSAVGCPGHEQAIDPLLGLLTAPDLRGDDFVRSMVACSLVRIGTKRSRNAAFDVLSDFKVKGYRDESLLCIKQALDAQQQRSNDPAELAEIEGLLPKLR